MFDFRYFLFLAPGVLLAMWAQWRVSSAYRRASQIASSSGYTGAQAADAVMHSAGIHNVAIEPVPGQLTDHYSAGEKALRLSTGVYDGYSLAALGIAAHEAGHALQDAERYPFLVVRNGLVPLANIGSSLGLIIMVIGFGMALAGLVYIGIAIFSLTVLSQVVNLPVEFNASRRARAKLLETGLVRPEEEPEVARVLNAAALTYVAATLTSLLTLAYYISRVRGRSRQ